MCGIFASYHHPDPQEYRKEALQLSKRIRHRGPDWSGISVKNDTVLCHERLAIVGLDSGAQPLQSPDGRYTLTVNGEIYNHNFLRADFPDYKFSTESDCEPIIPLFQKLDTAVASKLDGFFAFALYDAEEDRIYAARDPIGITSMYIGRSSKQPQTVYFSSELKCLTEDCDKIDIFPPGHYYDSKTDQFTRYYEPKWWDPSYIPTEPVDLIQIRDSLVKAVRKRLMTEVPFGVLLSGGLDSSLIASIAARESRNAIEDVGTTHHMAGINADGRLFNTSGAKIQSFAIGLPGAPDLLAARQVAEFIGSVHHEHTFTIQEGLDALFDVIYHLETYDVTTIRASTPMFLLSRKIKAQGVKMVLSGEGSDEIFGGYLYFGAAPSAKAFHQECVQRVKNLHYADCLRANKSTMAWGLEARVPFLDKNFLDVCMSIRPEDKMITPEHIEKHILRKAFDNDEFLPKEILWRQKEQFSDGVGYSWIDSLKDTAERVITDEMMQNPKPEWGDDVPLTKEAYWYRCIFDEAFKKNNRAAASTVLRWIPKAEWGCDADPSGRFVKSHTAHV